MAGSGALVQWHDPGLNRMNVAAKQPEIIRRSVGCQGSDGFGGQDRAMLDGNLPPHTMSSCGNEQLPHPFNVFDSIARASCQPCRGHQINSSEVNHVTSSRLRMILGLAQLAFGLLLPSEHFWSASAEADWRSEWKRIVAAAKKKGKSFFKGRVRRYVCYLL